MTAYYSWLLAVQNLKILTEKQINTNA